MSESVFRRLGRSRVREPKLPSDRDWERSAVLVPKPAPRRPVIVSDGGGLPFPLAVLDAPAVPLDPEDAAVTALFLQLRAQAARRRALAASRGELGTPSEPPPATLEGWRLLARTDDESLFGLGLPPRLITVAVRKEGRRQPWACVASSDSEPLRAARDSIRASSWRVDPTHDNAGEDTTLRVLVTEQSFAGGQRADGRVLAPDIFVDERELVLTMFVSPRPGYQSGSRNPETPVRVVLPHAVGSRELIDGALLRP